MIEWGFLPLLDKEFSEVGPDTLITAVASTPKLFAEMIAAAYRPETEPPDSLPANEQRLIKARRASEFIESLDGLPGILGHGTLNAPALAAWMDHVRKCAAEAGRSGICEAILGRLLARTLKGRLDEPWIASELAPLLEGLGTEGLFSGIVEGIRASRGITSRGFYDGGEQEHALASRFRERVKQVRGASQRLAATFESLAESYELDAARWDEEAARLRVGR